MPTYHPHADDEGRPVLLARPSTPSALAAWNDPDAAATVIPEGEMPASLNGIALCAWRAAPATEAGWKEVPGQTPIDEPPFVVPPGRAAAAGVVIEEADGRIWLVAPSNAFGGYSATFPKGRIDRCMNLQACAIREAFEETGLHVRITGWLLDARRTQTYTRYYRGERIGGTPAGMGWESQAVHLVPRAALEAFLTHPNDQPLIAAIRARDGKSGQAR